MSRSAPSVAVVDYGAGNLRSVLRALERAGARPRRVDSGEALAGAERVVFPGVGALPDCMEALRRRGLDAALRAHLGAGRPYLGICLGLQALFEHGEEQGGADGLGVLRGRVAPIPSGRADADGRPLKVPHMGWNALERTETGRRHPVLARIPDGTFAYFVHGYVAEPEDPAVVAATTDHGGRLCAAVAWEGGFACQFHPEKSQEVGEAILAAWLEAASQPCA